MRHGRTGVGHRAASGVSWYTVTGFVGLVDGYDTPLHGLSMSPSVAS